MPFVKFKRTKPLLKEAAVSINDGRFNFNSTLSKLAELHSKNYVIYHIDEDLRTIAFQFLVSTDDVDAYTLSQVAGKNNSFRSSALEVINSFDWVKATHDFKTPSFKTFIAIQNSGYWKITLRPAFEKRILRTNIRELDPKVSGIYKYINSDLNKVVYIGKGQVQKRAKESIRSEWVFDIIEYSKIDNEDQQFEWEYYWINQYKILNNGRLPLYNKQGGNKSK